MLPSKGGSHLDKLVIAGIEMPRTRTLEVGGSYLAKETTMASGKIVRDIIGYRKELIAEWEWVPDGLLQQLLPIIRSGDFILIEYPDPAQGDTFGMFTVEIDPQKIFKFKNRMPYWYGVKIKAIAQEVE